MNIFENMRKFLKDIADIRGAIDTDKASENIRNNIFFKGPNVWILVCAIILASVGLNINSSAVIIGAMLISPLMGPIFGVGLGLGTEDPTLIKQASKNLAVMIITSLTAATIYFLATPLKLADPTELMSRTNPTIYDVMIALFGGLAGIFELSRKEKGTVISGVAIATALMPPLCTAGYGIASGHLTYFIGALYLFFINGIFIILATYIMVKYLRFPVARSNRSTSTKRTKIIMATVIILVIVPSIWSAIIMIRENRFKTNVESFVSENKNLDNGYIYDHSISYRKGGNVNIFIAGEPLTATEKARLLESAERHKIHEKQIKFTERAMYEGKDEASEKLMQGIYERSDYEIAKREEKIKSLENELSRYRQTEVPYSKIAREIYTLYPDIKSMFIARGSEIRCDSMAVHKGLILVTESSKPLPPATVNRLEKWLQVSLGDSTVVVINR